MSTSSEILQNRERGNLPLSIGTSLAIEAACGMPTLEGEPRLKKGELPPIRSYDALWINVRTLFRNLYASMTADERKVVLVDDVVTTLSSEMHVIESTITKVSQGRTLVTFYCSTFTSLKHKFSRALIKESRTEKQKFEEALQRKVMQHFVNNDSGLDIRVFDVDLQGDGRLKTLMLTHFPVDLLSKYQFGKLTLLESHTGTMKRESQWYTKLTGKDLSRLPFNRFTLQLFGDGTMFASMPIAVKEEILELANKNRWTPLTTKDKIRHSLRDLFDPRVRAFYLSLL